MSGLQRSHYDNRDNPRVRKGLWVRSTMILAATVVSVGCYDQILVPADDADERITLTNDEFLLDQRASYVDEVVGIDTIADAAFSFASGAAALLGNKKPSVELTLTAEVLSPTVNGQVVQATSIWDTGKSKAVVSYNVQGGSRVGAVDYFDRLGDKKKDPRLKSSVTFNDSDVSAVTVDNNFAYAAEATDAVGFPFPAVLERIRIKKKKFTLEDNLRVPLTSFAATSVASTGSVIYATSGDGGGVFALDASDLSTLAEYALDDARWVTVDDKNQRVVVAQGTPGRISVFTEGNFAGGTLNLINTFPFPGANTAQSKSTVEVVGDLAFIAAGSEGVQVVCLDTGAIVGSIPRPNPADLGLSPSVVVSNAVTVDKDVMFISNGEAGVYVVLSGEDFKDIKCDDGLDITVLGSLKFDDLQSVNHVVYRGDYLFIAAGIGGLKVVKVKVKD
jgi:hypothetical protein